MCRSLRPPIVRRQVQGRQADRPRLSVIDRVEDLQALAPAWDELARRASQPPFALCGYVAEAWRSSGATGWCVVAHRGQQLVAALPLLVRQRFGAREGVLLNGAHRGDLLCDPAEPPATGEAVLRVVGELPVDWMPVYGVAPGSALALALPERSLRPQQEHVLRLQMPDGWDAAYRRQTSAKSRSTDRRKLRRLHELGEVRFDLAGSGERLQRGLDEAFEIYRRRWGGRAGESGGFGSDPRAWHAVAERLGSEGLVQLVTLRIDGVAVAFTYSFLFNGTMWLHRLAFDPALDQYSPGWLTVLQAIGLASQAGAARVDFGLGQEPYKARLATHGTRVLWGTAVSTGVRGAVCARVDGARFWARQRAKQSDLALRARDRAFRFHHRRDERSASAQGERRPSAPRAPRSERTE